jgi:hypothetical protein
LDPRRGGEAAPRLRDDESMDPSLGAEHRRTYMRK